MTCPSPRIFLDCQFQPTAPNRAWAADISYIRTQAGWLYLACVLDLYSRKVVGWAMAPTMSLSVFLWARRFKSGLSTRRSKAIPEEDSKLVHGGFPVEGRPHGLGQHVAQRQP